MVGLSSETKVRRVFLVRRNWKSIFKAMKEKTKRITYSQKFYQAKLSPKKWKQNRDISKQAKMMKLFRLMTSVILGQFKCLEKNKDQLGILYKYACLCIFFLFELTK